MSDQPSPFAPFATDPQAPASQPAPTSSSASQPNGRTRRPRKVRAAAEPPKRRAKRGGRRTPVAAAPVGQHDPEPPAPQRKTRKPRLMTFSVDALPDLIGLAPDEAQLVASVLRSMQGMPKKGRARVAAALAKLCA